MWFWLLRNSKRSIFNLCSLQSSIFISNRGIFWCRPIWTLSRHNQQLPSCLTPLCCKIASKTGSSSRGFGGHPHDSSLDSRPGAKRPWSFDGKEIKTLPEHFLLCEGDGFVDLPGCWVNGGKGEERVKDKKLSSSYCEVKYRRLISFTISYEAMIPHLLSLSLIHFQEACIPQKIDRVNSL